MVRISGFHPGGPGSIPGAGRRFFLCFHEISINHAILPCLKPFAACWGYSSVVEHSTADREVPGSNPGVPCFSFYINEHEKSNERHQKLIYTGSSCCLGCDGRVVKALDLKSNGIFPRRFEPYSQRTNRHRLFQNVQLNYNRGVEYAACVTTCCRQCRFIMSLGTNIFAAEIAQLGERQTEDLKVPGSIPGFGTLIALLPAVTSPGLDAYIRVKP